MTFGVSGRPAEDGDGLGNCAVAGFFVSLIIYPFAVYGLRRLFTERLGMESNIGFLVFLLASVVSWLAAEAVGRL